MALMSYLQLKGQKTGQIQGSVTIKGREGSLAVIAVSHEIVSPRDPASGLPTGKRVHKPLVITKELDQSSPSLLTMLTTNENITEWTLNFYATKTDGQEVNAYRIELMNAQITSYDFRQPDLRDPDLAKRACYEEVAFVYQKITWTWMMGTTISAVDDWNAAT